MSETFDLRHSVFQLYKSGKKWKKLNIVHNLPKIRGISINDAFNSWLMRTDEYTEESLCDYIKSKDPTLVCVPKSKYDKILKE